MSTATDKNRGELLAQLRALHGNPDWESAHEEADRLLLEYLGDDEITEAFKAVGRWYG